MSDLSLHTPATASRLAEVDMTQGAGRAFYPLSSRQWKIVGLPCRTKAYALHKTGELHLVKVAGRTGITEAELDRFLAAQVEPLSDDNKRDMSKAIAGRKRRRASA